MFSNIFLKNHAVCEVMWRNIVELGRSQMTIWCMCIACWITKATNTHLESGIPVASSHQQWLRKHTSVLCCSYIASLVISEHRDKKGFTPLILAATAGHEKVVEILLTHGADIEAQSERTKDTPLSLACSGGRYEVCKTECTSVCVEDGHKSAFCPPRQLQ